MANTSRLFDCCTTNLNSQALTSVQLNGGGALNSFDNTLDPWGNNYKPVHAQGVYGTTLDDFLPRLNYVPPT